VVSFILIRNVLSQPACPRTEGPRLIFELVRFGLVYCAQLPPHYGEDVAEVAVG
jgi:hypothetical protein